MFVCETIKFSGQKGYSTTALRHKCLLTECFLFWICVSLDSRRGGRKCKRPTRSAVSSAAEQICRPGASTGKAKKKISKKSVVPFFPPTTPPPSPALVMDSCLVSTSFLLSVESASLAHRLASLFSFLPRTSLCLLQLKWGRRNTFLLSDGTRKIHDRVAAIAKEGKRNKNSCFLCVIISIIFSFLRVCFVCTAIPIFFQVLFKIDYCSLDFGPLIFL